MLLPCAGYATAKLQHGAQLHDATWPVPSAHDKCQNGADETAGAPAF